MFGVLDVMVNDLRSLDVVRVYVNKKSRLHSFSQHNFWIGRNGVCPYCLGGSRAVHKVEILELLER